MKPWIALVLLAAAFGVAAQSTYRWVDKEGKVHYSDLPPLPAEAQQLEKRGPKASAADTTTLPYEVRAAAEAFPVTLFTRADCGAPCKDGRDLLVRRGVPFQEKTVATEEEKAALGKMLGGEAGVPVIKVGGRIGKGFLGSEWDSLLDAAGYPKSGARPR